MCCPENFLLLPYYSKNLLNQLWISFSTFLGKKKSAIWLVSLYLKILVGKIWHHAQVYQEIRLKNKRPHLISLYRCNFPPFLGQYGITLIWDAKSDPKWSCNLTEFHPNEGMTFQVSNLLANNINFFSHKNMCEALFTSLNSLTPNPLSSIGRHTFSPSTHLLYLLCLPQRESLRRAWWQTSKLTWTHSEPRANELACLIKHA